MPRFRCRTPVLVLAFCAAAHAEDPIFEVTSVIDGTAVAVATAGDLNDDGVPELAVGFPSVRGNGNTTRGAVSVRDGRTGAELFRMFPGPGLGVIGWGAKLTRVGDYDADGENDLAVTELGGGQVNAVPGFVDIVSLKTRQVIRRLQGTTSAGSFGSSLAEIGDVDGDGVTDLVVGEPGGTQPGHTASAPGAARVFSGATGTRLDDRSIVDEQGADSGIGLSVAALGDVDGDGVPDYAAGAPYSGRDGSLAAGRIVLRSGSPGGFRREVLGGIRTVNGELFADFLGRAIGAGDVNGDGVTEVLASGGFDVFAPREGFVRVFALQVARNDVKAKAITQFSPPGPLLTFGATIRMLPNIDGLPGREVLVCSENELAVFSLQSRTPRLLRLIAGLPGERIGIAPTLVSDLGSRIDGAPSVRPDGFPDIAVAAVGASRAYVLPLFAEAPQLPTRASTKLRFVRGVGAAGTSAGGFLRAQVAKGVSSFTFAFSQLPDTGLHTLFLETAPGSAKFTELGTFSGASGTLQLRATGTLPAEFGTADFGLLSGRVLELRNAAGTTELTSAFPYASMPPRATVPVALVADPNGPFPAAQIAAKLAVDTTRGKSDFTLRVRGVPKGTPLELWGETAPGSGEFDHIATLSGATLKVNASTEFAANFPGIDVFTLISRLLRLQTPNGVVVAQRAVVSTGAPDLVVPKASLRFYGGSFDSFHIRADVRNRGNRDCGQVNLRAVVTFVTASGTQERTVGIRSPDGFPAGTTGEDIHIGSIDNPFPGQFPDVQIQVTVDPAPGGGGGEYAESNEANNTRLASYTHVSVPESQYERN